MTYSTVCLKLSELPNVLLQQSIFFKNMLFLMWLCGDFESYLEDYMWPINYSNSQSKLFSEQLGLKMK